MKKIVQKLRKRGQIEPSSRITNDTVAEHREQVLAGGRKFKYPIQYSRHKLVINTVIISTLALVLVLVFGWWYLYPQQNTSVFAYRVVSVLPLPVAKIDGESVRYSDYLLNYRSSEYYLQRQEQATLSGENGTRQREYLKTQSLRNAIADTYASKLARDEGLTATDDEITATIKRQIEEGGTTERTFYATIRSFYDWDEGEYRHIMAMQLLRHKVAYAVDKDALSVAGSVRKLIDTAGEKPWAELVQENKTSLPGISYGLSGMVPRNNKDGGLAAEAAKLQKGSVSSPITSLTGDGYYILRLLESNERQVNYEYIHVPLKEFQKRLDSLYKDNKITSYINVSLEDQAATSGQ